MEFYLCVEVPGLMPTWHCELNPKVFVHRKGEQGLPTTSGNHHVKKYDEVRKLRENDAATVMRPGPGTCGVVLREKTSVGQWWY